VQLKINITRTRLTNFVNEDSNAQKVISARSGYSIDQLDVLTLGLKKSLTNQNYFTDFS